MFCQSVANYQTFDEGPFEIPNADYLPEQIFRLRSGLTPVTSDYSSSNQEIFFPELTSESALSSESEEHSTTPVAAEQSLICSIPYEFAARSKRESPSIDSDGKLGSGRRKQRVPHRSAARIDPDFRGALVTIETKMKATKPVLVMKSEFRHVGEGGGQRRKRGRSDCLSLSTSDSDDDPRNIIPAKHPKRCISCGTKRTPLWRDVEKSLPLCNACGIRYKKYKIRCSNCWHVPKRNRTINCSCISCGAPLQFNLKPLK